MLENYERLPNGVIKQKHVQKIMYNYDYSNIYNSYGEKGKYISYLRYGILIGVLGHIPKSIVDVGYGNGDFLNVCKGEIPEVYGCDISDYPIPEGCIKVALEDISGVDVTCFFDSFEHFEDITFLGHLKTKYVYISVPWCHYLSDEWFQHWRHRRENEHLYHFQKESLIRHFEEYGYSCIYSGNPEDIIRKNQSITPLENILTCIFKKKES